MVVSSKLQVGLGAVVHSGEDNGIRCGSRVSGQEVGAEIVEVDRLGELGVIAHSTGFLVKGQGQVEHDDSIVVAQVQGFGSHMEEQGLVKNKEIFVADSLCLMKVTVRRHLHGGTCLFLVRSDLAIGFRVDRQGFHDLNGCLEGPHRTSTVVIRHHRGTRNVEVRSFLEVLQKHA